MPTAAANMTRALGLRFSLGRPDTCICSLSHLKWLPPSSRAYTFHIHPPSHTTDQLASHPVAQPDGRPSGFSIRQPASQLVGWTSTQLSSSAEWSEGSEFSAGQA
ncbi:unnamed protein product [Protopolystoma xenopodis]|uniref:Uncharacterized protein n=1 Tax=Protopolystoma xenopodis TaxID=117903 RepID=A0A448WCT6_9PLAT|nr:unnamed protein product [Protopolystoma xenopodis]